MSLVPLKGEHVRSGAMLVDLDVAIAKAGAELVRNWELWEDKTVAKSEVNLKLVMARDVDTDEFSVVYQVTTKLPQTPKSKKTVALGNRSGLMCQESGTKPESARQEDFLPELTSTINDVEREE